MDYIIHLVVGTWILPAIIAGVIIWWARRSFRQFKAQIEPLNNSLREAIAVLEPVQNPRQFTQEYEAITPKIRDNHYIGSTWDEFESTLLLPTDMGSIRNTRRPSEYFNDGLFFKAGISIRTFESVPNQLVGAGLLCTFVGLVLSLLIAQRGIGADIGQAKQALADLLNAAAFKFTTSIAALGCSVAYQSYKNRILHDSDDLIERLCRELERLMVQVTPEALADESRNELALQTVQLERFNSELAISIAEALDGKLRESLGVAMQPVASEIGRLAERLGEINQDALEQMVDRFSSELSGAAKEHTDQMAKMLQAAAESIAAVPSHIDAAGERFSQQIDAGAQELSTSMMAAAENVDEAIQGAARGLAASVQAAAGTFGGIAEEMENSLRQQEAFADRLAEAQETMSSRLASVLDAANATAEQLASLVTQVAAAGRAGSGLASVGDRMGAATALLERVTEQLSDLAEHTADMNIQAKATVEALVERVNGVERQILSMNNGLSAAFEKVTGGVGQFGDKTTKFVKDLDAALAEALQRLSGAVQELDQILGEMPKKSDFNQLARAIKSASEAPVAAE